MLKKEFIVVVQPDIQEYRFTCSLLHGIHARPACCLEKVASGFESCVSVENLSNHTRANAKSVLSLVGADIKKGDACLLTVEGADCRAAYPAMVRFLEDEFPGCDERLPEPSFLSGDGYIPPALAVAGVRILAGRPAVSGFARGKVVFVEALRLPRGLAEAESICPDSELRKLELAVTRLRSEMTVKLGSGRMSKTESDVLKAHISIAGDVELLEKIRRTIAEKRVGAGQAIILSFNHFSSILKKAQSELIRERVLDLQDVCSQLLKKIYGTQVCEPVTPKEPSICVADNLTPSMFMAMDKRMISALVLLEGGDTSHTVILARSFGIPTLTKLKDVDTLFENDREMIVDANYGLLITEINDAVERFYRSERRKRDFELEQAAFFKDKPALTCDGVLLEVMANVATADEVKAALSNGADGIGLFRTEMLYMGRDKAPTEEEQFCEYKRAAEYADGKPVIIRTFDIGGDKPVDYLNLSTEANPFLGYRGARLYRDYESLLADQLRAILRASAFGNLRVLIPMVSCVEEVRHFRGVLEAVQGGLDAEGVCYDRTIRLGVMVEVPAAAFLIAQLSVLVDFLSIGTNDLTQYVLAVDRGNDRVKPLYQSRHPGVLDVIKKIVEEAHRYRLPVGVCGEMAGQSESLPLLLGAGVDDVSVSIPFVAQIKAACSQYNSEDCRQMLKCAVRAENVDQVNAVLKSVPRCTAVKSVIDVNLIDLAADCLNKEEVIKYASEVLYFDGRTEDPIALEKDFWRREAVYSTGLGHGFSIPHCKTKQIQSDSICVLRLPHPVQWGSLDDEPVTVVIAMTIRDTEDAGDSHLKTFSKLARNIMHEDFRDRLRTIGDRGEVAAYLHEKLEIS